MFTQFKFTSLSDAQGFITALRGFGVIFGDYNQQTQLDGSLIFDLATQGSCTSDQITQMVIAYPTKCCDRNLAINNLAETKVTAIVGDITSRARLMAFVIHTMYQELRNTMSTQTQALLDPIDAELVLTLDIRTRQNQLLADGSLDINSGW